MDFWCVDKRIMPYCGSELCFELVHFYPIKHSAGIQGTSGPTRPRTNSNHPQQSLHLLNHYLESVTHQCVGLAPLLVTYPVRGCVNDESD